MAARVHPFGLGPPAPRRWSIGNAARRLRMVRERRPWERRSRQSFRGGETGAGRCRERSPGSLGGETPDFFTWVGRAAHGGHAARTLSREGDAATVTRRRTDRPQWCQVAGMNGSDLEKNRDLLVSGVCEKERKSELNSRAAGKGVWHLPKAPREELRLPPNALGQHVGAPAGLGR